jgi:hypothetical protein
MQAEESDGSPSMGSACIRPTRPDYDLSVYSAGPQCGVLDVYGRLTAQSTAAIMVFASDDENSQDEPFNTVYNVTIDLYGQEQQSFNCYVPGASTAEEQAAQTTEGSPIVTLTSLIASNAMLGQSIVGANWPEGAVVVSVSTFANTVTLDSEHVPTATGYCTATVGGAVLMEALVANAL